MKSFCSCEENVQVKLFINAELKLITVLYDVKIAHMFGNKLYEH